MFLNIKNMFKNRKNMFLDKICDTDGYENTPLINRECYPYIFYKAPLLCKYL